MRQLAFKKANPVASAVEVERAEATTGMRFPDALRAYLLVQPTGTLATQNTRLPLAENPLAADWVKAFGASAYVNILLAVSENEGGIVACCQDLRRFDSLPEHLVPVATDWVGNFIMVACSGDSRGLVTYYDRGEARSYPVAASYADFIDALSPDDCC
jgi:cell wall assembly regulator SMI1